ncbi:hypothetical protein K8I28_17400 [bacterium]|nr:hypothetical protein [bacterium]
MSQPSPDQPLFLGFDIGGTSTKALLTDRYGNELAKVETAGMNMLQVDRDQFQQTISSAVAEILQIIKLASFNPVSVAAGAAGAGGEEQRSNLESWLGELFPAAKVAGHHDAYIAHYGAFAGDEGVIVIAGTGSIAFGRNRQGTIARAGGWGWLLGDEGSGWWIGKEAIRALLLSEEVGEALAWRDEILEALNLNTPREIIAYVYSPGFERSTIAQLSKIVAHHAANGDSHATKILSSAGSDLATFALIVAQKLGLEADTFRVAPLGSIFEEKSGIVLENLTVSLGQGHVIDPEMDALHGAAKWARDNSL